MHHKKLRTRKFLVGIMVLVGLAAVGSMCYGQISNNVPDAETVGAAAHQIPIPPIWYLAPIGSIVALLAAWALYKQVVNAAEGDEKMMRSPATYAKAPWHTSEGNIKSSPSSF